MKPLQGIKVLDFSQRLPGPLAGMLLADLGAEVIKIEDQDYQDAFLDPRLAAFDDSFIHWYRILNQKKKTLRLNFNSASIKKEVAPLLSSADVVLHGMPEKYLQKLGLSKNDLENQTRPLAVLEIGASSSQTSMHDLNAMASVGLLRLMLSPETPSPQAPPLLPLAGIAFGQQIALKALAQLRQAQRENKPSISQVYLYEELLEIMKPFWTQEFEQQNRTKFLHNGKYPCYCLYRLRDGNWVAVASVEEKFWLEFLKLFNIKLTAEDRFNSAPEIFQTLANAFEARTTAEVEGLLKDKNICVSLIRSFGPTV